MLERILALFDSWLRRWEQWVFAPGTTFPREKNGIATLPFFLLNLGVGYVASVVIAMTYFAIAYTKVLREQIADKPGDVLTAMSGVGLLFVVSVSVAYFFVSLVSFAGFKLLATKVPYREHMKCIMELSFVEPLVAIVSTIGFLIYPPDSWSQQSGVEISIFLASYFASRAWALVASFYALRVLHAMPSGRMRLAFGTTHLLGYALLGVAGPVTSWIALVGIAAGGD